MHNTKWCPHEHTHSWAHACAKQATPPRYCKRVGGTKDKESFYWKSIYWKRLFGRLLEVTSFGLEPLASFFHCLSLVFSLPGFPPLDAPVHLCGDHGHALLGGVRQREDLARRFFPVSHVNTPHCCPLRGISEDHNPEAHVKLQHKLSSNPAGKP